MRLNVTSPPTKRRGITVYVFLLLTIISFALLVLSTRSFVIDIQEYGRTVFSGLRIGISTAASTIAKTIGSIKELTTLRAEYLDLSERFSRYEMLERDVAEVRSENARLKEQLGYSTEIKYRHIAARIIGKEPDNIFSAYSIDKGSKHGIRRNMPVIAYQDGLQGLLGKVVQVSRTESLVMPLYDVSSNISVRLVNSRYEGILFGQGGVDTPLVVRYIKNRAKDDIKYGDVVVTSGLGRVFPSEIHIGRVIGVLSKENDSSLELEIESPLEFSRIEYVFVIDAEMENIDG